ncbi:hypothetical protein EPI10_020070 [Gossypium australe]|uniref:Uncharacterized protein n=1 Tax=Gossypium australe TaxID=47621 RepID=A0A5B6WD97_9ROSI|nr:hypothetical protein EPI10_020070 [Gossypium australe]
MYHQGTYHHILGKRVGNGHNIRIEEDVWVPNVNDLLIKKQSIGKMSQKLKILSIIAIEYRDLS